MDVVTALAWTENHHLIYGSKLVNDKLSCYDPMTYAGIFSDRIPDDAKAFLHNLFELSEEQFVGLDWLTIQLIFKGSGPFVVDYTTRRGYIQEISGSLRFSEKIRDFSDWSFIPLKVTAYFPTKKAVEAAEIRKWY